MFNLQHNGFLVRKLASSKLLLGRAPAAGRDQSSRWSQKDQRLRPSKRHLKTRLLKTQVTCKLRSFVHDVLLEILT